MALLRRFLNIFRPARLTGELDEELEFHHQMRLRRAREQGLTTAEAEIEARRRMGSLAAAKEGMRDARVVGWLASSLQDLRGGVVLLRRDGGVSALIVLVLALGIGGNAAIFTLLKAALLDPLPYRAAERLITVDTGAGASPNVSEFLKIREQVRTLDDVAFAEYRDYQLSGTAEPVRVFAARVTSSFFPLLGVSASLGRTFIEEENQPGRAPTVIVSDAFWRTQMGAEPSAVGKLLRLDGEPALVVGVLPPEFHFDYPSLRIAEPVDIYISLPVETSDPFDSVWSGVPSRVLGRLRHGVTHAQAQSELQSIAGALVSEHPEAYRNRDGGARPLMFRMTPLRDAIVGTHRSLLWLLLGGVGVLLLIACANTAQLLLARSLRRGREVAVRIALGASRLRLIRQFLLEGLVLAVCGGLVGLLLAGWVGRLLVTHLPARSPVLESAHVDARVAGFTLALSIMSAIVFAIVPAMKGSKWTPGPSLSARSAAREGNKWRHAMVALEAALSVFLLCGAGLVAQNLWTLVSTPMGFNPNHVLTMRLKLPTLSQNALDAQAIQPLQEYLEKIAAIPGVESAATVTGPPLRPSRGGPTEIIGETDETGSRKSVVTYINLVSPDYFRTLRIPLLAGRTFSNDDVAGQPRVSVVNEEFARQFGLGRDVVGRQTYEPGEPFTIVGMVGNVRTRGLRTDAVPETYLSSLQFAWGNPYIVVRSAIPPVQLVKEVKEAIQSTNSEQAVFGVMTMEHMIAESVTEPRFHAFLIGAFALLAVTMATAGMYSVIACLVSQRTSEIAIRKALGASHGAIVRAILGTTTVWVAAGLAFGLALGIAASSTVRSLSNTAVEGSMAAYVAVAFFFLAVTLVAAYIPVRRASRLDPSVALRCE